MKNKKVLLSLGLAAGLILLSGGIVYADELKESLKQYLQDDSLDFLGHKFEDILFQDKEGFIDELKFIWNDIRTMPLQLKAYHKIITQKPNIIAYGSLGSLAGLKSALGAKEFNKMVIKILRLIIN